MVLLLIALDESILASGGKLWSLIARDHVDDRPYTAAILTAVGAQAVPVDVLTYCAFVAHTQTGHRSENVMALHLITPDQDGLTHAYHNTQLTPSSSVRRCRPRKLAVSPRMQRHPCRLRVCLRLMLSVCRRSGLLRYRTERHVREAPSRAHLAILSDQRYTGIIMNPGGAAGAGIKYGFAA